MTSMRLGGNSRHFQNGKSPESPVNLSRMKQLWLKCIIKGRMPEVPEVLQGARSERLEDALPSMLEIQESLAR